MPPSKRKLKAQAASAEAPHVKATKARRARDHDADPDAADANYTREMEEAALHASLCLLALSSSDAEYSAAAATTAFACNTSATDPAATDNDTVPAAEPTSDLGS